MKRGFFFSEESCPILADVAIANSARLIIIARVCLKTQQASPVLACHPLQARHWTVAHLTSLNTDLLEFLVVPNMHVTSLNSGVLVWEILAPIPTQNHKHILIPKRWDRQPSKN